MMPSIRVVVAIILVTSAVFAQTPSVREDPQVYGRPGWVIENAKIRVAILRGGGHIAEIRLLSSNPKLAINPMFIPAGNGYMGHMVCFPNFGPASPEERQAGIAGHGEANAVEWQQSKPPKIDPQGITFFYGAELPKTQYHIERAVSLKNGESVVRVEESVENLAGYDRPYNWDQHATFGAPFVAAGKNVLDLSGTRGMTDPRRAANNQWATGREFAWPNAPAPNGGTVSLREFRAVPGGQAYTPVLADPSRTTSWFTLSNTDSPLLVGYMFATADHPWIIDWQNRPNADSPVGTARGIEFGTSPVDEGLRKSVERGQMFGVATYRFIAAKQRLSTSFTVFLAEVPAGFAGVQDVRIDDKDIVIVERGSGRGISVRSN
jgi:hypothetical protein